MSLIRPEARAILWRARDLIFGGILFCLGFYALTSNAWPTKLFGGVVMVAGCALLTVGFRRLNFPSGDGGPGVVEVDERQISYFGPQGGGAVSLEALSEVRIVTTGEGPLVTDLHWIFMQKDGTLLQIPGDAAGTETLFDALSVLNGVDHASAAAAFASTEPAMFTLWKA